MNQVLSPVPYYCPLSQLVLDNRASEVVLAVVVDNAGPPVNWLSASHEGYYDLEREVLVFRIPRDRLLTPHRPGGQQPVAVRVRRRSVRYLGPEQGSGG